jgi:hypothetical protein
MGDVLVRDIPLLSFFCTFLAGSFCNAMDCCSELMLLPFDF